MMPEDRLWNPRVRWIPFRYGEYVSRGLYYHLLESGRYGKDRTKLQKIQHVMQHRSHRLGQLVKLVASRSDHQFDVRRWSKEHPVRWWLFKNVMSVLPRRFYWVRRFIEKLEELLPTSW